MNTHQYLTDMINMPNKKRLEVSTREGNCINLPVCPPKMGSLRSRLRELDLLSEAWRRSWYCWTDGADCWPARGGWATRFRRRGLPSRLWLGLLRAGGVADPATRGGTRPPLVPGPGPPPEDSISSSITPTPPYAASGSSRSFTSSASPRRQASHTLRAGPPTLCCTSSLHHHKHQ